MGFVGLVDSLNPVSVGIDIGQIQDNTAICVAEIQQIHTGRYSYAEPPQPAYFDTAAKQFVPPKDADPVLRSEYFIRHIQRLPLGMGYPDVAQYIADMLCKPIFAKRKVKVLIDVTGVGRAIYDDLRREIAFKPECREMWIRPISFVHGEKYNKTTGSLGKAFLVSRLQSLLQGKKVHAPDTSEVNATLEELRVYEIKVSDDGKETFGATTGKHDDLATAMALSCLEDPFADRVTYSRRVY